jgi:nucleotide-binding universal stress UspA family protein
MPSYKKIVFPTDLSQVSLKIVPHVKEIADRFDAEVHVIYVAHVRAYYTGIGISSVRIADFEVEVIRGAEKQLQEFVAANLKDRTVTTKVLVGHPGEMILTYVQAEGIDLIVMGHSRKGIKRMIMGSVAGHVVKEAPVPVLIVNPDTTAADKDAD